MGGLNMAAISNSYIEECENENGHHSWELCRTGIEIFIQVDTFGENHVLNGLALCVL